MVNKILNISLVTKKLKKLHLYAYSIQKWAFDKSRCVSSYWGKLNTKGGCHCIYISVELSDLVYGRDEKTININY